MLEPRVRPDHGHQLQKQKVLRQQAEAMGLGSRFLLVSQITAWQNRVNAAGAHMKASNLDTQDSLGGNDGSINSILTTYLADAWCFGNEILCGCDVQYIQKHVKGGYLVYFRKLNESRSSPLFAKPARRLHWVHAKKMVFLGAGSLGLTEIALRSKRNGFTLSLQVGTRLGANGGVLAFGYDLDRRVNRVGMRTRSPSVDPPDPTISGLVDCGERGQQW